MSCQAFDAGRAFRVEQDAGAQQEGRDYSREMHERESKRRHVLEGRLSAKFRGRTPPSQHTCAAMTCWATAKASPWPALLALALHIVLSFDVGIFTWLAKAEVPEDRASKQTRQAECRCDSKTLKPLMRKGPEEGGGEHHSYSRAHNQCRGQVTCRGEAPYGKE